MRLHDLKPAAGSRRRRKRIGRGISAGQGKTAGKGQKGQFARTPGLRHGFEGGQMPLAQRLPKLRGFHNRWKKRFAVLNLTRLNRFKDGAEIRPETLLEAGIIKDVGAGIKVLGTGDLSRKLTIYAHRFSAEARRKIEAAGGAAAVIEVPAPIRPKTKRAKNQPKPAAPTPVEETPAEGEATGPAKASKKAKGEKAEKAAKPDKAGKAEKSEKAIKGQAAPSAPDSPDSTKAERGKKKS